jgi:ubiquinone/menaquinone biosynthesis C-methylase UbiE
MACVDALFCSVLCYAVLPAIILYLVARYAFGITKSKFIAFEYNLLSGWMHRKFFNVMKKSLFERMRDLQKNSKDFTILEIGVGSGLNFAYYPAGTKVIALDPNPHHEAYIRANLEKNGDDLKLVRFVSGYAEDMSSIESDSLDAVVCTLTMCAVKDPTATLAEVKRVLKPGGTFFFLEHVAAEHGSFLRGMQNFLQKINLHHSHSHGHGGHINRETWVFLNEAGFRDLQYRHHSINTWILFFAKPCIYGTAVK